jgi:uncharacterized protein (DUF169 family)
MNDVAEAPALDAKHIASLAQQLTELLRLRTFPIGMKLFTDEQEMARSPGCAARRRARPFPRANW